MVCWSCERCDTDNIYRRGSEKALDTEEVLGYFGNKETIEHEALQNGPACDALFEKSRLTYCSLHPEMLERDGNASTYESLLEILNVCILPNIAFQVKHRVAVQQIHEMIKREFDNIETLIEMNVQTLTNYEESLEKQRKRLLTPESISNISKSAPMNVDFIELLLKHSEKDVMKLDGILISLAETIKAVRSSTDKASVKLFTETCAERNRISKEKERIILAKETLEEEISKGQVVMKRKAKKSKLKLSKPQADKTCHVSGKYGHVSDKYSHMSDKYEEYSQEAIKIETLRDDIKQQINVKIRLSTIRESVISALKYI